MMSDKLLQYAMDVLEMRERCELTGLTVSSRFNVGIQATCDGRTLK